MLDTLSSISYINDEFVHARPLISSIQMRRSETALRVHCVNTSARDAVTL